jgi:transcriptional regulator with XRE-family HTH domain
MVVDERRKLFMDQKKTGYFFKILRSEKQLTQEQLAERFNVSSRTVSRWETGSNMPDISVLLELADFYEVDIREIIDGERKSEKMNEELKETVMKVTDYADANNARILKRVRIIGITGVIAMVIAMIMETCGVAVSPIWEMVKQDLYGWTLGTLIANVLYTTGWLKHMSEKKDVRKKMLISGAVCAVIVIMSFILQIVL